MVYWNILYLSTLEVYLLVLSTLQDNKDLYAEEAAAQRERTAKNAFYSRAHCPN
jgi:hypothetical protein